MPTRNIWGRYATVTTLRDGTKGSNARGTCLHKTTRGAKRAKGQFPHAGLSPAQMPNSVR